MKLSDFQLAPDYNKAYDNIAQAFYLPCMRASTKYSRISGYFSSAVYIIAWNALKEFVNNGGRMRIVCSPFLSEGDISAINEGYLSKEDTAIAEALSKEIEVLFSNPALDKPARVLACLISKGIIEVKVAVPVSEKDVFVERLFHDKVGIFEDASGNAVGFRGPMNETYKGLSDDGNLESIDVFPSWEDSRDSKRVDNAKQYFEKIWAGAVAGISVYSFPSEAKEILAEKSKDCDWKKLTEDITREQLLEEKWKTDKSPNKKKPRKHQYEALENWEQNGRRGIFKHATGSGKTYSAICAIRSALDRLQSVLVIVPSIDLLSQWKTELQENITDIDIPILACGGGNNYWKRPGVLNNWTQKSSNKRIVLVTVDTAASNEFIDMIADGEHLLIVADEVHRLGSPKRQSIFQIDAGERLGLSATPERYGHPEETEAIFEYFGGIVQPEFSLVDAIKARVLTEYVYNPLTVRLTPYEQDSWNEITKEINRLIGQFSDPDDPERGLKEAFNDERVKKKLIARARIIKNAENKIALACETIEKHYKDGQRWIVYCDNQKQLHQVTNALLERGYNAYEYYAEMVGDRQTTLMYFSLEGGILVSIKCLDEGVDIPATTHALILASSKNPREFIQRRGRILRNHAGKSIAYLFDAITVPNQFVTDEFVNSDNIILGELSRAVQFGKWAINPSCIAFLENIAIEYGIDLDEQRKIGEEDDEE